ncbi:MAG: endolytic transglycosylase MltG [Clostridia bacterium]|nr:endolytic transglycosylase MltG [Clostridia bacterium]
MLRPLLVGFTALVVTIGLGYTAWNRLYAEYLAPADEADTSPVAFSVTSGQSLSRVANNLESAGLIRSGTVFKYYCDFAGFGQKIQAGDYELNRAMTMNDIADRLTQGDGSPLVRNITLIPGWSVEDFAAYLKDEGVIASTDTFLRLCREGTAFSDFYYVADVLGSNAGQRKYALEGYLAANTYEVYVTATEEDIIRRLLSQTERLFPADMQDAAASIGLTMNETLTLASLIEKEAKTSDFAKVSAVFHNRLKAGMPLESDVTVHYATGIRRMSLTADDLNTDSPYNTYRVKGLPPGPICSPSGDAIAAALNPDPLYVAENYLYFCAKEPESGELYFSRTLSEHQRAVEIYAPLWRIWDEKRGLKE